MAVVSKEALFTVDRRALVYLAKLAQNVVVPCWRWHRDDHASIEDGCGDDLRFCQHATSKVSGLARPSTSFVAEIMEATNAAFARFRLTASATRNCVLDG